MGSVNVIQWLKDRGGEIPGGKPSITVAPGVSLGWDNMCNFMGDRLRDAGISHTITWEDPPAVPVGGTSGGVEHPAAPLPDPKDVLRKIVEAINEAEGILNSQNLVIAAGNVQANLTINVGGLAAQTTIQFSIQPKPYS